MLSYRLGPALASVGLGCGILFSGPIARDLRAGISGTVREPAAVSAPAPRLPEGVLVARLTVSRLGLDSPVLEGIEAETLAKGAGHVPGTALPGEERATHPSLIAIARGRSSAAIAGLRLGDRVQLTSAQGLRRYRVVERRAQEPGEFRLGAAPGARVTLITPFPPDFPGPAPMRLAVVLEGRD